MKKLNTFTALVLMSFGTAITTPAVCHCLPNTSTSFFPGKVFVSVMPGVFCTDLFTKNMPVAETGLLTGIVYSYTDKNNTGEINNSAFNLAINQAALFKPGNIFKTV